MNFYATNILFYYKNSLLNSLVFFIYLRLLIIKFKIMKNLCLYLGVMFCTVVINAQKVYTVEYSSRADVKVFVVDFESQADLCVYKVDYSSQVGKNDGNWYFVDYSSQSGKNDGNWFFVDYASQSDKKIFFTD